MVSQAHNEIVAVNIKGSLPRIQPTYGTVWMLDLSLRLFRHLKENHSEAERGPEAYIERSSSCAFYLSISTAEVPLIESNLVLLSYFRRRSVMMLFHEIT